MRKKPKILVVCVGLDPALHYPFYELQRGIHKLGYEVHVLTTLTYRLDSYHKNLMKKEGKHGVRYHFLDPGKLRGNTIVHLIFSRLMLFFAVIRLNARYNYQIVHDYSSLPLFIYLGAILKRCLRVRVVHTIVTCYIGSLGLLGLGKSSRFVDKCICVTRHQWNLFKQNGSPEEKLAYIPLGVDCERFTATPKGLFQRSDWKIPEKCAIVLFLARVLTEQKGAFILARAVPMILKEHADTVFIFATLGSPVSDKKHSYHKLKIVQILEKHLNAVMILEGYQSVPQLMALADIVVLPLTTPHGTLGYPQTLLEAMASRKAIVASDIIGINEVINNGKNGLLFQSENQYELARQVLLLLKRISINLWFQRFNPPRLNF